MAALHPARRCRARTPVAGPPASLRRTQVRLDRGSPRALPSRRSLRFSRTLLHLWDRHEINGALASVPVRGRDQKQTSMVILLFRWFLDMDMQEPSFDATVFTKNRKRVESIFGWMKASANFPRTRWRGIARTQLAAYLVALPTTFSGSRDSQRHDVRSAASCEAGR